MVKEKSPSIRALLLITTEKSANIATEMFKAGGVYVKYGIIAEGTASSEILDMLGLGSTEKRMLLAILPKKLADVMLKKLHDELSLNRADGGIGFTVPITGVSGLLMHLVTEHNSSENDREEMKNGETDMNEERKYTLISAVINRGFGGDVMTVARGAGAKGGTIVHSRQLIDEESTGFWGISMQEEKEILLIIAEAEQKLSIMKAISEKFGLHSDAKGIVTSMPIDTVMGF